MRLRFLPRACAACRTRLHAAGARATIPQQSSIVPSHARFLTRVALSLIWGVIASISLDAQDVRRVVNMAYPGSGSTRFTVDLFGDPLGEWPTIIGDVNGDGYDDILYRRWSLADDTWPDSLLVWGGPHLLTGPSRSLEEVPSTRILHQPGLDGFIPRCRRPFAPAGDIDADGLDDFLITTCTFSDDGLEGAGRVIVVFGQENFPEIAPLWDLPTAGLRTLHIVSQEPGLYLGGSINRIGDLNGDGNEDFAIGASGPGTQGGDHNAGRLFVIFGEFHEHTAIHIKDVGSSVPGFVLQGASGEATSLLGDNLAADYVEGLGDVNGDGVDDLLVPAKGVNRAAGAVYIVYGRPTFDVFLDAAAPESFGVAIEGIRPHARFGTSISRIGDVDNDGLHDFLVGEPGGVDDSPGAAYLIYGSNAWPARIPINDPTLRKVEIRMTYPPPFSDGNPRLFGWWVEGLGDWNSDGYSDFAVGAPWQEVGLSSSVGNAYVIFGGPALPAFAFDLDIGTHIVPGLVLQGHRFLAGFGVAGDLGDIDGDHAGDLLITAALKDDHGTDAGSDSSVTIISRNRFDDRTLALSAVDAPAEGPLTGGTRIKIRGRGFGSEATVFFGGRAASDVRVVDSALVEAFTPPTESEGSVDVEVVQGPARVTLADAFRYRTLSMPPDVLLDPDALRTAGIRNASVTGLGISIFAGDLNADGRSDLLLGSLSEGLADVFLVFGRSSWDSVLVNPDVTIHGDPEVRNFGIISELGADIDGDGYGDVLLGGATEITDATPSSPGRVYALRGYGHNWPRTLDIVGAITDGQAFLLRNRPCYTPLPVTMPTPDGGVTLAVSQIFCSGEEAVVSFYRFADSAPPRLISTVHGDPTLAGTLSRRFGSDLVLAGDMNGDNWADLLVGSVSPEGAAFLILGSASLLLEGEDTGVLDLLSAGRAVRVTDGEQISYFGQHVDTAGDVNGDGLADVILSAELGGSEYRGASYILYGSQELGTRLTEIDFGVATDGFTRLNGELPGDAAGFGIGLGDWNGDGYSDVAVTGTFEHSKAYRLYVVFGRHDPDLNVDLGSLDNRGFKFTAPDAIAIVSSRLITGDFNGDSTLDLAAPYRLKEGPDAGSVLILFGRTGSTFVRGDANDDGTIDIADAVTILGYLFLGNPAPRCLDASDTDDSGQLDLSDAVRLLNHLFLGAPPPPAPYPEPGDDVAPDALACS